jgi:hypothetical protein
MRARRRGGPVSEFSRPGPGRRGCNSSATAAFFGRLCRWCPTAAAALALLLLATSVAAQETPEAPPAERLGTTTGESSGEPRHSIGPLAKFLAGGALALGVHESGHVATDFLCGAPPGIKRVSFGPIPFFAITHDRLSPRREFLVASAGFWMQHAGSEVLLTSRPRLRAAKSPLLKGWLAFNVLASAAYAGAAMAHAGPAERDTRSMAEFLRVDEAAVGGMLLVPAGLDTVRFFKPEARWAAWASRAAKVAMVLLVAKKAAK